MIKVGIYCLDQDRNTTSTLGVYNHTRNLIRSLAQIDNPGIELVLFLSEQNKADMCPTTKPDWMSVCVIKGKYGSGIMRLWADHVLANRCARSNHIDVMHYPKGWMPLFVNRRTRHLVTIHDAILFTLRYQYTDALKKLKAQYFCWMTINALKKADRIITDSEYSRRQLCALRKERCDHIELVYQGAGLTFPETPAGPLCERKYFMLAGSMIPHKATRQTITLINHYAEAVGNRIAVKVTGLSEWPKAWGRQPSRLDLEFLGRVSDEEVTDLMRNSRMLFYLSTLEGFGLPAIEGYLAFTPVCYRNTTSLAEVMQRIPGGWDGERIEHFVSTVLEMLTLTECDIQAIRATLIKKYSWERAAPAMINIYKATGNQKRSPSSGHVWL